MTSLALAQPRPRHGRRTAFGKIVLNEGRLAWRRPIGLIGGVGIPAVLLVVFGEIPRFSSHTLGLSGVTLFNAYVPILIVFCFAMLALMGLPIPLASYRELGILRRLSTTPVPPTWLLAAQAIVQLCVAVVGLAFILIVATAAFGASAPKSPGGFALSCVLSIAGLFPLGLLIASVARTANTASIIGRAAFFPLIFFAGLWLPQQVMPGVLQDISDCTPLGAAVKAIGDSIQGQFPPAVPLLVLGGYAVVFSFLARRFFRWE
jgi:ABC-2 type transport system permease protein